MINEKVNRAALLAVGPRDEHHANLIKILAGPMRAGYPDTQWTLASSCSLTTAWPIVEKGGIPIVLFDCDHDPAAWRRMLDLIHNMPAPPYLIVTSRLADDHLWSEALHLGAYDVLAKPFEASEVVRVLRIAWLRWQEQHGYRSRVSPKRAVAYVSAGATA